MGALDQTIVIDRPVDTVFQWTTNMEKSPEIMTHVEKVEKITPGPVEKGTRYHEVRNLGGRRVQSELEVIDYIPNERYSVTSEQNGVRITFTYTFKPEGDGTYVTFDGDVQTAGLARSLFKGMIVRMIAKEEVWHLKTLKEFIEKETSS